jgi:dihydroflavonol-4-reductase
MGIRNDSQLDERKHGIMTILVTGATGLVGNNLLRLLLARGDQVRALVREGKDPRPLAGLDVEHALGDVRDAEAVRKAMAGVSAVIHAAGHIHLGWSGLDQAREINVEGTRNVAAAAREAGARLVHVSSNNAMAVGRRNLPVDEETPRAGFVPCTYVITKHEAELIVWKEIERGLDAVVVNPGFMLGPWDWKPSSGRMLLEVARRFIPVAPIGGCSVCDVRDVSAGILAALDRGTTGRRYLLCGQNMPYFDLWRMMADISGGKGPWFRAGPVLRVLGAWTGDLRTRLTGRESDLNSAAVKMSGQFHYYSSARAERELGYRSRAPRESLEAAWGWFREHGYA